MQLEYNFHPDKMIKGATKSTINKVKLQIEYVTTLIFVFNHRGQERPQHLNAIVAYRAQRNINSMLEISCKGNYCWYFCFNRADYKWFGVEDESIKI